MTPVPKSGFVCRLIKSLNQHARTPAKVALRPPADARRKPGAHEAVLLGSQWSYLARQRALHPPPSGLVRLGQQRQPRRPRLTQIADLLLDPGIPNNEAGIYPRVST